MTGADIPMLMRYTAWADERLYAALAPLPAGVLHSARSGRPAGLIGTLGHMLAIDVIWRAHLEGRPHGLKSRALAEPMAFDALRRSQAAADDGYCAYAAGLSGASLAEVVDYRFVDGGPGSLRRGDILLQVVNHKTYHRGYVAGMLYESGLQPPTMDLPVFLRDADAPRSRSERHRDAE